MVNKVGAQKKVFKLRLFSYPSISKSKNHHSLFTFSLETIRCGPFVFIAMALLVNK
jgi:hypothetical protein